MSTPLSPPVPYFYADSLKERFSQDLTDALLVGRINEDEEQWLRGVLTAPVSEPAANAPRLDRLSMDDAFLTKAQLASAVLISHEHSSSPEVYLSTLWFGLERFKDREQLQATLNTRYASPASGAPTFEAELIEGPLFEQRMLTIIDQQSDEIEALAEQLQQLPSLQTALSLALKQQIESALPGASVEPSTDLLQLIQTTTLPPKEDIVGVQNLEDAALEAYTGQALGSGQTWRFLNASGETLGPFETQRYQRALSTAARGLNAAFVALLDEYWQADSQHHPTRRDYAAERLSARFQHALHAQGTDVFSPDQRLRLQTLFGASSAPSGSPTVRAKALSLTLDNRAPLPLAGVFLIDLTASDRPQWLLYSEGTKLQRFPHLQGVYDYCLSAQGRSALSHHLALHEHDRLRSATSVQLSIEDIQGPLFLNRIDSIIALQKDNVAVAIARPYNNRELAMAMVDDALDIRQLINGRLLRLGGDDRWSQGPDTSNELIPSSVLVTATAAGSYTSWMDQLKNLDDRARRIRRARPCIESCAREVLNRSLSMFGEAGLDARSIQVQLVEDPAATVGLITLLLEQVTGHRTAEVPAHSRVFMSSQSATPLPSVPSLTPLLINHLLQRARAHFPTLYLRQTRQFHIRTVRQGDTQLRPGPLACSLRETLLRIELDLEKRLANLSAPVLGMLQTVLNKPLRSLRQGLGDAMVDVYAVSLTHDSVQSSVWMSNAFVMYQPSRASSGVVLWSSFKGLRVFESLDAAKRYLSNRLTRPEERARWLDLLPEPGKGRIRRHLEQAGSRRIQIDLHRLDAHFIEQLQQTEEYRHAQSVEHAWEFAVRCQFDAGTFSKLMAAAQSNDKNALVLDTLSVAIQGTLFESLMPAWLKTASLHDLSTYTEIVQRYYLTNNPEHDFLAGIPHLKEYTREQLLTRLSIDFPDEVLHPDTLQITLTRFITAPVSLGQTPGFLPAATQTNSETLTDYALNHFASFQSGATLTVTALDGSDLPSRLTADYVKELVRGLDLGKGFQTLLAQKLNKNSPDYDTRRDIFFLQWPALLLESAFGQKLDGQITTTAYDYIESVVDMPDGLARQTVQGEDIVLRPLGLVAASNITPDTVSGCYLIGPKDPAQGPLVLHAIFHPAFSFKEYANEAEFLQDLRSSSSLQTLILERVSPQARVRYEHGGFSEPHLPTSTESSFDLPWVTPGPVTLSHEPIEGNALLYLYEDTQKVLKDMAAKQTVTTAQADSASRTYWLSLWAEQALMFVPGKLGLLVTLWQSHALLRESAAAASKQQWGKALLEFTAALGALVSSRQSAVDEAAVEESAAQTPSEARFRSQSEFSWRNAQLPRELKTRLQAFEVQGLALNDLVWHPLFNLYEDPKTLTQYAAVAGRVYPVKQLEGRWSIVGRDKTGPGLRLNDHQQWELDLQWGLKGGGGNLTRLKNPSAHTTEDVDREVKREFTVLVSGMPAIRLANRDHARRVGEAHQQAKQYLEICLDNLNPNGGNAPLDARISRINADSLALLVMLLGRQRFAVTP